MLEEQQEDLRKKRCADRYDSSESSDSGVAALSGGESLSSCGSSNNGDNLLASPPCSPASSGELIICDDHHTSSTTVNGNVDQLLHGRILTSGLSTKNKTKEEDDQVTAMESDDSSGVAFEDNIDGIVKKEEQEKKTEDGASFADRNQEETNCGGLKQDGGKVAIVNPIVSINDDDESVCKVENDAMETEQEVKDVVQVNVAEEIKIEVKNETENVPVIKEDVSSTNCINTFATNNSLVQFSTFAPQTDASKLLPAATPNNALVNGLLLQQQPQNIKFLQCLTNNGMVNGQVRICNNSSILLNNAGYPILKNNSGVLGAIQNNLTTTGGATGQVAVTTWNGSPILINANALTNGLNPINNNNMGTNENVKKCNAATQICKNQMTTTTGVVNGKVCQTVVGNKRQSPVKEQNKNQGSQNNVAPCPAKKPRSACKTEQQKHNTRTAQHSCCPNKTKNITTKNPKQEVIENTTTTKQEKSLNIDPVVINTLQKNCVSIQQITTPAASLPIVNKNLTLNNKNLLITQNTTTQLIVQQQQNGHKFVTNQQQQQQQQKCQSVCTNNREITNYFKAQVKPQRRAMIDNGSGQVLATSAAKMVATQSDYLAMLTAKTRPNQQVLLEKRSYDVRTLTLATPTALNNNNQLANHNNNLTSKPSQQTQHLITTTSPLTQQTSSFKIGGIEVSLKSHQPEVGHKSPLPITNQMKITKEILTTKQQVVNNPAVVRKPRGRPCVNIAPRIAKKPKCIAPKTDMKASKTGLVQQTPVVTAANPVPQQQNLMAVSQQQATTVAPQTVLLTTYTTNLPGQQNLTKLPAGLILNGTPSGIRFQQSPQPVYVAANPFLQPVYVTKPFLQQVGYGAPQFTQFATTQFQNTNNGDIIGSNNFGSIMTPEKEFINTPATIENNGVSQLSDKTNDSLTLENPVVSSINLDKNGTSMMDCDNADQSLISENAVSCQSIIDESLCDPTNSITETASTFTGCLTNLPDKTSSPYNAKTENIVVDNSTQKDDETQQPLQPEKKKEEIEEIEVIEEPKSPKSLILERIQQKLDSENSFSSSFEEERKESTESQEPRVIRFPAKFPCNGRYDSGSSRVNRDNFGAGRCVWDKCHGNYDTSSALLEHLQTTHVTTQSGPRYACHWRGCRVYGRESSSRRWLDAHVASAHAGSTRTLQCIVAGCRRRFSSQLALQRHVNNHFNEAEGSGANAKKSQEPHHQGNAAAIKLIRKNGKKLRYRRQPWSARMFDFFDGGAMEGLQYRLLCTEALAGGAKGTVLLRSDILGRRLDSTGKSQVLVTWNPPDILPDEWIPEIDYRPTKEVDIKTLPNESKCEISNHIETLTKKQEKVPRKQSRKHKSSSSGSSSNSVSGSSSSGGSSYSSSLVASWFDL